MMHVAIVAEHNLKAEPALDKQGREYPRHYVWVRKPWQASPTNPDPVTPHPIPVFIDRQHKGAKDWEPLPLGTRVLVTEVDKTPLNPEGLAVVAMGPQTDAILGDTRETSYYRSWEDGGIDRAVVRGRDPVTGPNADYGRDHYDGEGMGYESRGPYPGDFTRRQMELKIPGITVTLDHRIDDSTWVYKVQVEGTAVTYDLILDTLALTATLKDDKGNKVEIASASNTITVEAVTKAIVKAATVDIEATTVNVNGATVNLAGGGPAVARVGDAVQVDPATGIGTITSGSAKTSSG